MLLVPAEIKLFWAPNIEFIIGVKAPDRFITVCNGLAACLYVFIAIHYPHTQTHTLRTH